MTYKNEYYNAQTEWDALYSSYTEKAEDCYIRWINNDTELTEAEVSMAIDWKDYVESDEPDLLEIEIPPEFEVSSEEFEAFVKIARKLQQSGIANIINAMLGNTVIDSLRSDCMKGNDTTWENTHL